MIRRATCKREKERKEKTRWKRRKQRKTGWSRSSISTTPMGRNSWHDKSSPEVSLTLPRHNEQSLFVPFQTYRHAHTYTALSSCLSHNTLLPIRPHDLPGGSTVNVSKQATMTTASSWGRAVSSRQEHILRPLVVLVVIGGAEKRRAWLQPAALRSGHGHPLLMSLLLSFAAHAAMPVWRLAALRLWAPPQSDTQKGSSSQWPDAGWMTSFYYHIL